MYLNMLNQNQKQLFLNLAYRIADSDNDFSEKEQEIIKSYCIEMQIEDKHETDNKDINYIIEKINNSCDFKAKKIFVFEAIGLALVDSVYNSEEKDEPSAAWSVTRASASSR